MAREWGKVKNSYMAEPKSNDYDDSVFWEHLHKTKIQKGGHRKYTFEPPKSPAKKVWDAVVILAAMCAFVYCLSKLNPFV